MSGERCSSAVGQSDILSSATASVATSDRSAREKARWATARSKQGGEKRHSHAPRPEQAPAKRAPELVRDTLTSSGTPNLCRHPMQVRSGPKAPA